MYPTPYADVNALLADLVAGIQAALGPQLVGVYLFGSLAWGDFDRDISDVDVLAVMQAPLSDPEFAVLDRLHHELITQRPGWRDRIEVGYLALPGVRTLTQAAPQIALISPGEPFHRKRAGRDWLINWYLIQEQGVALVGPALGALGAPVSRSQFVAAVREQAREWASYVVHTRSSRPYQGYAILTLCRALFAATHGAQCSKQAAAHWAAELLPEWRALIADAVRWRLLYREPVADPAATYAPTERFVQHVVARIEQLDAAQDGGVS